MERRWRAWRRTGEREGRWPGLGGRICTGGAGNRKVGGARGGRGMCTWDSGGGRRGARSSGSGSGGGWGCRMRTDGAGNVDMGRQWQWRRRPGERERRWWGLWGGGCVRAARGTGRTVLLVGGGGRGHETVVACVAAPRGAEAARAGPWGVVVAPRGAGVGQLSG